MLRRSALAFVVVGLAVLFGCASPTLPLPPPNAPQFSPSSEPGKVHLRSTGGAEPNAVVVVINRSPDVPLNLRVGGAQADEHGSWETDVVAKQGDYLDITQEFGSTRSPATTVKVP